MSLQRAVTVRRNDDRTQRLAVQHRAILARLYTNGILDGTSLGGYHHLIAARS
jgi:hypothetical protein